MNEFDEMINRSGTNSLKYDFMAIMNAKADATTLPLWVADMDFACPQPILDAIKARTDRKILGYSGHMTGEYFRAIGNWMQRRFNWYVHSSDIFISPGVVPALSNLVRALTSENDGIIIQRPVYYPFTNSIVNNGRKVINNALIEKDGYYTIDFDDLEQKAKDPSTKMMIFCSPHNPVGRVWTEDELRKVGQICLDHDVILVSDEIHFDLISKGHKHIPIDRLFPKENRIITCTAPSKTFNLAGMHTSNIIIKNDEFKKKWSAEVGSSHLGPLSIVALQAAYDESEDWLDQVNDYIDANLDYIGEYIKEFLPKAKYYKPEGTYLAWLNLSAYEKDYKKLSDLMVEEAHVLLDDGHIFGEEGNGFERINAACPRPILKECLDRIALVMNRVFTGNELRDFTYDTPWKTDQDYSTLVSGKKNYLIFLRYYGCTLCQLDLKRLIDRMSEFTEKDTLVSVVLQSDPALIHQQVKESEIPFNLICDPAQKLFQQYYVASGRSIRDSIGRSTLDKIKTANTLGLIHGAYEGNELQYPAVILFNEHGIAEYVHYGKELGDVPSIDEMLAKIGGNKQ